MHGLQWDYSFPRSPHGEYIDMLAIIHSTNFIATFYIFVSLHQNARQNVKTTKMSSENVVEF
jgi:hypothetical protein